MQLPTLGPLELINRKEQLSTTEIPVINEKPQNLSMDKEADTNPDIVLPKEEKLPISQENVPKTQKKLIPEFILGIILTLLGGYQINNNLFIGSFIAVIGIIMVLTYIIVNRKKGIKDATDKQ